MNNEQKVIAYHRWGKSGPENSVVVIVNFSTSLLQDYTIGFPADGEWAVRFNSDSKFYDKEFTGSGPVAVAASGPGLDGQPFQGVLTIAPYSVLILSQEHVSANAG